MSDNGLRPVDADKRSIPIVQEGGRVRRAGSRRQARIAIFVVVVIAVLLVGGYFLFIPRDESYTISDFDTATVTVQTLQDTVELSGTVNAREQATVTAPESGTMGTLLVEEGDWVTNGELIALLEVEDLEDDLDSEELSLASQERDYERFLLQHEYELSSYDRQRENLEDALADAREELADTRDLYELGSASQADVDEWEDAVEDALDAIDDHNAEVEEALAIHELDKSNYEDDLLTMEQTIADLEERILDARVTSPMDGRVISIADAATTTGEMISQYETLMEISDSRNPVIETEIEEQYVSLIAVGQPVSVDISSTIVMGAIERIGLTATSDSDGGTPTVELDIAVDVGDSEITIGTSTVVEVLVGEVADAVVLPRGPYLTSGNRKYLYRVDGDFATRVEVTYGTITDDSVEILSGIEPGDEVVTSSYTNFIEMETVQIGGTE